MLELRGVYKTFNEGTPNEVRSLQGVDLLLDEGSFVMIIGTNGSGKSTLLNATGRKPDLLLLDEHTAALDPRSADQIITLTEQVVNRDKLTTLMVTHSMHQATTLGDRLIMMHRGKILHDFRGAEKSRLRV